jgi:hypothetical protein
MGRQVTALASLLLLAVALTGCSQEEKVDVSQEKSPSLTGDVPKATPSNSAKSNPVGSYKPGTGPGVGDALK